jgi:hypothetical protein
MWPNIKRDQQEKENFKRKEISRFFCRPHFNERRLVCCKADNNGGNLNLLRSFVGCSCRRRRRRRY